MNLEFDSEGKFIKMVGTAKAGDIQKFGLFKATEIYEDGKND